MVRWVVTNMGEKRRADAMTDEQLTLMVDLKNEGWTNVQLAKYFGKSEMTITNMMRRFAKLVGHDGVD